VIETAIVLDLTPVSEGTPIGVEVLERGVERLRNHPLRGAVAALARAQMSGL
jgi:hypothetical protein